MGTHLRVLSKKLSNGYQHDQMVIKNRCILDLGTKIALALEGLRVPTKIVISGSKILLSIALKMSIILQSI